MHQDRSAFTQTTAEVTLDIPAAAALSSALYDAQQRAQAALKRSKSQRSIERNRNHLANLEAAERAFDQLYRACLNADLYTAEHQAEIDRILIDTRARRHVSEPVRVKS